jgi:hypothetical protein
VDRVLIWSFSSNTLSAMILGSLSSWLRQCVNAIHRIAAFALLDLDHHPSAVDIAHIAADANILISPHAK